MLLLSLYARCVANDAGRMYAHPVMPAVILADTLYARCVSNDAVTCAVCPLHRTCCCLHCTLSAPHLLLLPLYALYIAIAVTSSVRLLHRVFAITCTVKGLYAHALLHSTSCWGEDIQTRGHSGQNAASRVGLCRVFGIRGGHLFGLYGTDRTFLSSLWVHSPEFILFDLRALSLRQD